MTNDLKDVLIELDSKIAEVYDLDLAEEMSDIYIDLSDRVNELYSQYWKLVKALARTEKNATNWLLKKIRQNTTKTITETKLNGLETKSNGIEKKLKKNAV